MKKILLLLIGILVCISLYSQNFKGGIMAGLSATQVDGDTYSGYHRAGLIIGAFVNNKLSEKFDWQMELKYIQKGSYKNENPDAGDYSIYSLRLNYAEVPFLLKYYYKSKFVFEAGLAGGYLAKSKESDELGELPYDPTKPKFHKFEFNSQLGGYFKISNNFSVNIRYSYSIFPVRPHAGGVVYHNNRGQYNNVLQFSLFYCLNNKNE